MKPALGITAVATAFGSIVHAQIAQICPASNVCYSLNIPDTTASSGNGDIYFQITAPTSYTWVALGQGSQMAGANIFVLYTDASGTNVTLSPRLGTGHVQPKYNSNAQVSLLEGTTVSNGIMTANVRCSSCMSWSGGSMDFTESSGTFIYAYKSGNPLDSDLTSASISQHDVSTSFQFSFSQAKGGSSLNPFSTSNAVTSGSSDSTTGSLTASSATSSAASTCSAETETSIIASPTGSGCPTAWPSSWTTAWPSSSPTEFASCYGRGYWPSSAPYVKVKRASSNCVSGSSGSSESSASGSSGSNGAYGLSNSEIPFGGDFQKGIHVTIAHGVLAGLAFVILFPFGAISIRLFSFPGLVWFHAAFQTLAYLVYIAAFGLGIYLAMNIHALNNAHPIIGIVLFILVFFQPFLGFIHHRMFKRYNRRTFWSYAHVWLGRVVITLGMINGGLGLRLASDTRSGEIAYGVIAAVVWLIYVASIFIGERRKSRNRPPSYDRTVQMGQGRGNSTGSPRHREWYGKRT